MRIRIGRIIIESDNLESHVLSDVMVCDVLSSSGSSSSNSDSSNSGSRGGGRNSSDCHGSSFLVVGRWWVPGMVPGSWSLVAGPCTSCCQELPLTSQEGRGKGTAVQYSSTIDTR